MKQPTLYNLHEAIGGKLKPAAGTVADLSVTTLGPIVTDSRQIAPGDVFWAIRGPRYDGTDFAHDAFNRGAAGAIVRRPVEVPPDRWMLKVDDTQRALWQWAAWHRRRFGGTLIAVTGSVGKTTTRQMIDTVLRPRLAGSASPRNYNNHIGVPLSMLAIEPEHDYAVLELGASSPGEIAALAGLCAPKVGVITHIGDAHLGGFGSRRGIARSKTELLAALPTSGRAVLVDNPWVRHAASGCKVPITWVGCGAECDVRAEDVSTGAGKLTFRVQGCDFRLPVWGRHHLSAALAAVAVARTMGFDLQQIAAALADFHPLPMRCEVIDIRGATVINDTYNASPTAMHAALELLRDFDTQGRRIVVCGDMAELGDESVRLHRRLGNEIVTLCRAEIVIACGQFARDVVDGARAAGLPPNRAVPCRSAAEALPYIGQAILPGDVVLVKGSRVMAMERVVEALRQYPRRRSA